MAFLFFSRAFDAMEQLKWDISPASESGYTVKEIQSALDDSFFLALLTAGLLYEPAMMYEDQENILLAADMLQHTRQALGAAYGKVGGLTRLIGLTATVQAPGSRNV